ncbi:MAG TPA: hypothetical protein DHU55_05140 [Blastocatellia bacterium]|nr:hypothetical protein [Blastocatellia bacterium]
MNFPNRERRIVVPPIISRVVTRMIDIVTARKDGSNDWPPIRETVLDNNPLHRLLRDLRGEVFEKV